MEIPQPPDHGLEDVDCMDVMETLGYMDLIESNDFFDPSCIFQSENNPLEDFQQEQMSLEEHAMQQHAHREHDQLMLQGNNDKETGHEEKDPDDMATVFLEWLRTNKETVSAEDLRSVRIKKATIESAARRLGGGKEAMKQLLKLVLEWVQTNHLQKRRNKESPTHFPEQYQDPFQNSNPNADLNSESVTPEPNPCFATQSSWIPQTPYVAEPTAVLGPPAAYPPMVGYMGDPYTHGASNLNSHSPYPAPTEYHMLDSSHSWSPSQFSLASHYNAFPENNLHQAPQPFAGYGNQYPYQQYFNGHGERLLRLGSSATKEARKKRMARQRRFLSHHRHHHNHHNQQNQQQSQNVDQHARLGGDNCTAAAATQANPGNWVYWPSTTGGVASGSPVMPAEMALGIPEDPTAMHEQNFPGRVASDRRQGWKPEKNLRFLLQKVLKQSDVGNLGRIVLPKKEAETHLPELEARDGISIAMEDIGTSRVWNMRYRYWPNNKSRMYLLENTGDFVRANGLQEGDFIVIYSDVKCGKYMIRGVKVRQPGPKSESKRPGKSQKLQHATSTTTTAPAGAEGAISSSPTARKKQ
ncbi:hypothetical protein CIPAW_03G152600 [Carya illinoinensis]|nr:hypothetical protein CIPAW_03G152600 [Carya illinoinensis]